MTEETSIDWQEALRLLTSGEVVQANQSHGSRVTLIDATGNRYAVHQPEMDAILRAVQALPEATRNRIVLSTE